MQSLATILLYAAYGVEAHSAWLITAQMNQKGNTDKSAFP